MLLWKKHMVNRHSLAAPFFIDISSSCKGELHHLKLKSERPVVVSTETIVNTIGTMLADDDSLSQWQIALVGFSQTTVE